MKKPIFTNIFLIFSAVLILIGLIGLNSLNQSFSEARQITFADYSGSQLLGTYIPGSDPVGVIFLEGFGSDQVALRPAARTFLKSGAHVFTFDFSGHGRSPGALGFDNAATDRLAKQIIAAKDTFKTLSGLDDQQIVYFGHSLGARAALQAAVVDTAPPAALILLGTQVNLGTNVQAEFFTGTSDAELDWVQSLSAQVPKSHILLLSGEWDDVLTPDAARALYDQLRAGGESASSRQLNIFPSMLHNYEIYSTRILREAEEYLDGLGLFSTQTKVSLSGYFLFGSSTLLGLVLLLMIAPSWLKGPFPILTANSSPTKIIALSKFLWGKLLLWLGALIVGGLLTGIFFLLPFDLPVMNMIYVGFIGGYGLLFLILYLWNKVPGTDGALRLRETLNRETFFFLNRNFWLGLLSWTFILIVLIVLTRSGLFYTIAPNQRLLWLAIFTPFTAIGFWVSERENLMLKTYQDENSHPKVWPSLLLTLISLTPFFLYTAFLGILGSISGMVGGLQGLIILGIVILTGRVIAHFIRQPWIVALLQSILLYALILPQGVLFAF